MYPGPFPVIRSVVLVFRFCDLVIGGVVLGAVWLLLDLCCLIGSWLVWLGIFPSIWSPGGLVAWFASWLGLCVRVILVSRVLVILVMVVEVLVGVLLGFACVGDLFVYWFRLLSRYWVVSLVLCIGIRGACRVGNMVMWGIPLWGKRHWSRCGRILVWS